MVGEFSSPNPVPTVGRPAPPSAAEARPTLTIEESD
jgi:hypothetical protein